MFVCARDGRWTGGPGGGAVAPPARRCMGALCITYCHVHSAANIPCALCRRYTTFLPPKPHSYLSRDQTHINISACAYLL